MAVAITTTTTSVAASISLVMAIIALEVVASRAAAEHPFQSTQHQARASKRLEEKLHKLQLFSLPLSLKIFLMLN